MYQYTLNHVMRCLDEMEKKSKILSKSVASAKSKSSFAMLLILGYITFNEYRYYQKEVNKSNA